MQQIGNENIGSHIKPIKYILLKEKKHTNTEEKAKKLINFIIKN